MLCTARRREPRSPISGVPRRRGHRGSRVRTTIIGAGTATSWAGQAGQAGVDVARSFDGHEHRLLVKAWASEGRR